jgi:hypothetical protein
MADMRGSHFSMSWKALTIVAICISVASLATISVIVSIKDVDVLSTVALTLAVLAFVAQLLIYIAQTAASSEQIAQNLSINSETKGILAEIRARTGGTEAVLKDQFNVVLRHALGISFSQVSRTLEPSLSSGSMLELGTAHETSPQESGQDEQIDRAARSAVADLFDRGADDPMLKELLSYPDLDVARSAFDRIKPLSPLAIGGLIRYANAEISSRRIGSLPPRFILVSPAPLSEELLAAGLLEEVSPVEQDGQTRRRTHLSKEGRETVRIFTGEPPAPSYIFDLNSRAKPTEPT